MWQAFSGIEQMLQATCPHWNAVSFFRSIQIEHIWASSNACILFNNWEKSDLFTFKLDPVGVSFSLINSLHWIQRFRRMLQSTQTNLCWHGEKVMATGSSSHNLHLSFLTILVSDVLWIIVSEFWGLYKIN